MFTRDTKAEPAATPVAGDTRNVNKPKQLSSLTRTASLSRSSLHTTPIAESTHIGLFGSPGPSIGASRGEGVWNGSAGASTSSSTGQFKRKPTSPLSNSRTLFKSSGNLSIFGRTNSQVYTDAQSPGLVNRLVRYYDREQSNGAMNRSHSLSSVYNKPGQFPVVHLRKQELRYGLGGRRKGNLSTFRIPPPEQSVFQVTKRSSILRTGSLLMPGGSETQSYGSSPFGVRGTATVGGVLQRTAKPPPPLPATAGTGCDESDVENRVITPCAEPEATPTRSVLDALKEISRKRINSEELDADRIKKQCKELSELDAAGSGPPSATAAVATGTLGLAAKRSREQASSPGCGSPSSPSDGSGGTIGAGEQQSLKKRFCSKNNDILSSLSSSLVAAHTPKQRVIAPRADRRLQLTVGSPSLSASLLSSMPTSSSTPLSEAAAVPGSSGALRVDRELADAGGGADAGGSGALQNAKTTPLSVPPWPHRTGPSGSTDSPQPDHRVPPKITLFNRPYDAKASPKTAPRATVTSDGEEDEGAEGGGRVQFVKPKEKSTSGISGSGGAASSDPLKKPPPSKLSVMLKCLSGDLGEDDDEEEDEEVVQEVATMTPKTPQATAVSGSGTVPGIKSAFAFTTAKDTVDAPKESTAKAETPTAPAVNRSLAMATSSGDGISALLNNPIKDAGLGKTVTQQPEKGAVLSTPQKEVTPGTKTATAKPAEIGQKQVAFTFGPTPPSTATATTAASDAQGTNTLTSSAATVNSPVSPTTTSAASSTPAPAATFSFGTPTAKTPMASGAAPTPGNLISFSPAPGGFGAASNTSPMFGAKPTSPVVQFGAGTGATTTTAAPSQTPAPASLFSFGASASAAASTTSTTLAASATTPTFGGSTFSAFKSPLTNSSASSPSTTVPTATTTTNAVGSGTFSAPPETTSPSTFSFGAVVSSSSTSAAPVLPVFGSTAAPSTGSTFTFGGTVKPSVPAATTTPTATAASGAFTFGAVAKSTAPGAAAPSATSASASTFSFGGAPASLPASSSTISKTATNVPATFSFGGGPKAAEATAATETTNLFAASAPNVFGASLASSGNNPQSTAAPAAPGAVPVAANLFAVASQTAQSASASAPSAASIFGGSTAGILPAAGSNAPLPFTFGAKSTTPATAPTALPNGQNLFASPPSGASNTAASGAMFTFGSQSSNNSVPPNATVAATNSAPQGAGNGTTTLGSTFGGSSGLPSSNPTQPATTKAPFAFGATAKPSVPGSGIFGGQPPAFGATQSAVPTFGSGSTGGSIFGSAAANTGSAGATAAGNIFGSSTPPVNGAPNGPAAPSAAGGGALFTFGATNNANSGMGGSATVGSTFGAPVAGNGNTFGLTNGLGSGQQQQQQQQSQHPQQQQPSKPFTFGAGTVATGPTPGPTPGGFNFNLGSNVQSSPVAKPFAFGGAAVGATNAPGSNPPMFGAPQPQPSAGSPFTFGASNNTQQQAANTSGGPFTFGSTQPSGPAGGPPPNVVLPFSFSAGNVATVAPQPQQRQQADGAPAPFTFNAAGRGPFGGVAGAPVGGAPTFGGAPVFGAPVGMPTFSIGTNSTPNGPPAGQRRIKTATRRIK